MVAVPPPAAPLPAKASAAAEPVDVGTRPDGSPWPRSWTVYRGVAYDLEAFLPRHPGGAWLVGLAVGRDSTALVETYHLRDAHAAAAFERLPVIEGFPVGSVPRAPRPSDSPLYATIRARVRAEVFGGAEARGAHRRGSEPAAAAVLGFAAAAYALYVCAPGPLTGALLGLAGGWIGVTVQHCGNHGAMSTRPWVNLLYGACDDLIGGSSLAWRYHHQVSHHIHTNDAALDEDVTSMFPLLRFDARLPRRAWHRWQHWYVFLAYPLMHLAFQWGDAAALARRRTPGAVMAGATRGEVLSGAALKLVHAALLLAAPWALHGARAALAGVAAYSVALSLVLATVFFVSHNLVENKPGLEAAGEGVAAAAAAAAAAVGGGVEAAAEDEGDVAARRDGAAIKRRTAAAFAAKAAAAGAAAAAADNDGGDGGGRGAAAADAVSRVLLAPIEERDWGVQQVLASANWGGGVANFFTGGLNLQIEHHLFPAVSFAHYPAIAAVVRDECARRGVRYTHHGTLWGILAHFVRSMRELGRAPDLSTDAAVAAAAAGAAARGKKAA